MQTLTVEQVDIVAEAERIMREAHSPGMGVQAFAGTGKTFTLVQIAQVLRQFRILYLAFNRAINEEMKVKIKKLALRHMTAKTGHGLAWGPMIRGGVFDNDRVQYRGGLMKLIYALQYDYEGLLGSVPAYMDRKDRHANARAASTVIIQTVNKFLQSADDDIAWNHVPYAAVLNIDEDERFEFSNTVAFAARNVWREMTSADSRFPITPDVYLKAFALTHPQLGYDVILYDEGQDANPVILNMVMEQRNTKVVMVGDSHQSIYQFRGAEDAMEKAPGNQFPLTKSWRFGPEIAEWANKTLRMLDEDRPLIGGGPTGHIAEDLHATYASMIEMGELADGQAAILCRSNAGVVREAIAALAEGVNKDDLAVVGGTKGPVEDLRAAWDLHEGRVPKHEEFGMLKDWDELIELSETDEGANYRPIVKMIDEYGEEIPDLCDKLDSLRTKDDVAKLIISTAHKGKGREWAYVKLSDDFPDIVKENPDTGEVTISKQEMNLLYVSITRATNVLNLGEMGVRITQWEEMTGTGGSTDAASMDSVQEESVREALADQLHDEAMQERDDAELMEEGMTEPEPQESFDFDMGTMEAEAHVNKALKALNPGHPAVGHLQKALDLLF